MIKIKNSLNCNNLLIRGVSWVGDAVMSMPAIRAIRDNFSDSHISLLIKPWVKEIFRNDPNVNDLIEYKKEYEGLLGRIRAVRDIRKFRFDCAYLLQNAFEAALLSFLSGIPKRTGYKRDARGPLLSNPVAIDNETLEMHHIKYYLNLLSKAGLTAQYRLPWIYPLLDDRLKAREKMYGLKRPVIGLNPGAAYGSAKRWYSDRFGKVAERVITELGGSVVLFGTENEHPISIEITNNMHNEFISEETVLNLSGKTTLHELVNLIPECDVVLSNDSGPLHICYATGTPLVALFGSTSPELTGPPDSSFEKAEFGCNSRVLKSDIECSPCFERTCRYGHLNCMDQISSDTVFNSVRELLTKNKAVFFDRDGTLCKDAHYLNSFDNLEIFSDVNELHSLKEKGYLLIGITNQSGIARGIVQESFVHKVNQLFIEKHGFDAFYYCPHHPDERCACRKPMPGMLLKARAEHNIDLKGSYFIGDKESDMMASKTGGLKGVHIMTSSGNNLKYSDFSDKNLSDCISNILLDFQS